MARGDNVPQLMRVQPGEVVLGMFIHGFEGSWWQHPFWRTRFLLTSHVDWAKLRKSSVAVVIDLAKGVGPGGEPPKAGEIALPSTAPVKAGAEPPQKKTTLAGIEHSDAAQVVSAAFDLVRDTFADFRFGRAVQQEKLVRLVDDITHQLDRNMATLLHVLRLKSRHQYTYLHSVSVCTLMVNLARQLNLEEEVVRAYGVAGLLHDVGKMAIPDSVLDKPGRLTADEVALVRTHPEEGAALLRSDPGIPELAIEVCLHHHERYDGRGYPHGLTGEDISLAARMGAICDVYDALTSQRPYKEGWSPGRALKEMWNWEGQFDRDLLFRFMQSIGIYAPGMIVRLRSGRIAMVRDNGPRMLRTRLHPFHGFDQALPVADDTILIDGGPDGDQIVGYELSADLPTPFPLSA